MYSPALEQLIQALRILPGVGPKSAQRMAFQLLERNRDGAEQLAQAINQAMARIGRCRECRMFSEAELCSICASAKRDHHLLCVVEGPADVVALEQSTGFQGRYFVLMGRLSPIDGIGPEELGLAQLQQQLATGQVAEMIVATNPTVEGEATAHYLASMARSVGVAVTRIAHGVPVGGELEYVDGGTLAHAFAGRTALY